MKDRSLRRCPTLARLASPCRNHLPVHLADRPPSTIYFMSRRRIAGMPSPPAVAYFRAGESSELDSFLLGALIRLKAPLCGGT